MSRFGDGTPEQDLYDYLMLSLKNDHDLNTRQLVPVALHVLVYITLEEAESNVDEAVGR
jgi:hypothetical protein